MFTSYSMHSYTHIVKSVSIRCTGNSRLESVPCKVICCLRHIFFVIIPKLMLLCLILCHCYNHSKLHQHVSLCAIVINTVHNANYLQFEPLLAIQFMFDATFHYNYYTEFKIYSASFLEI